MPSRGWPAWGWAGLVLIAVNWPLNWCLGGLRTAYLFFPLWLGYILTMDALVCRRTGTSLLRRSLLGFCLLFAASAPAWWLFEAINDRTANWEYLGSSHFTVFEYYLLCTISFSTVMPAVFESAELARSFRWVDRCPAGRGFVVSARANALVLVCGFLLLGFTLAWPRWCYPLVWVSLVVILEPINRWLGRPSLLTRLAQGDRRPLVALAIGALLCGFFWECWNFYSYPKWIYHTPGAEFWHLFEMPLLGYGGYIPFALELFGLKQLLLPHRPELRL